MSIFSEAWRDTRKDMRRGARRWLRRHPATNLLAWGAATVTYTLPKRAVLASHRTFYRKHVTVTGRPSAVTTVTTTETTTVTATTRTGLRQQRGVVTTSTTETGVIHMSATSRLLGSGDLARSYAAIIEQVSDWTPNQGFAATSIAIACNDLRVSTAQIASGLNDLNMTYKLGNIDERVRARITEAINLLINASEELHKAGNATTRIYVDQINQEGSGVPMAGVYLSGAGAYPLDTARPAGRASRLISAWLPEKGNIVDGMWTHLGCNQFALTLWGRALDDLADRLDRHGVHRQVHGPVRAAAEELRTAGTTLFGAKRTFMNLYNSQGAAESSGATVTSIGS